MKIQARDFSAVRIPVAVLIATLVAAYSLIAFSTQFRERTKASLGAHHAALQVARERYHRSGEEREAIEQFRSAYEQLLQQGFVGSEKRVNWIESLRLANARVGLFGVNYTIHPQARFDAPGIPASIAERVRHSQMKLSFDLRHEGDLMRFVRALAAQRAGLFTLAGCSIDRGSREVPVPREPNLKAECELSWITVTPEARVQ
jgi:hypothetical protein